MKYKFKIIVLLLLTIFSSVFYGCKKNNNTFTIPVTIAGSIFGGQNTDRIKADLSFSIDWITKNNNTIYNNNLAEFSTILCDDVYFREKDVENNKYNRVKCDNSSKDYNVNLLMEELGFSDVKKIETYKYKNYELDTDDSATFTIGYQNVNNLYDTFVVAFRGCYSIQERDSIADIGVDNEEYYKMSGEHTEWTDKNICKGFDVAKNRSIEIINEYIKMHDRENIPNTILITGHSRGASIASLLGAEYEKNNTIKSYTYTFNTPKYVFGDNVKKYNTIFNLINDDDFYSYFISFQNENINCYGQNIIFNVSDNTKIKNEIYDLTKRNDYICIDKNNKEIYKSKFGKRFPNRNSLYELNTIKWDFATLEDAKVKYNFVKEAIGSDKGLNIEKYCILNDIYKNENEKYEVKLDYCGAAILNCMLKITAYGDKVCDTIYDLFSSDEVGYELFEFISKNLLEINTPHLLINAYAASVKY